MTALRWLVLLPLCLMAAFLSLFLLHFVLYATLTQFVQPYPEFPERALTPAIMGLVFVWTSFKLAPRYNSIAAIFFAGMWLTTAIFPISSLFYEHTIFGQKIEPSQGGWLIPCMSLLGPILAVLIIRKHSNVGNAENNRKYTATAQEGTEENSQHFEREALDDLLSKLENLKVPVPVASLEAVHEKPLENRQEIYPFQSPTTNILNCDAGDIFLLIHDGSALFDSQKSFGIDDMWVIDRSIEITIKSSISDVPEFIALSPEEVELEASTSIHVSNYFQVGQIDQSELAWKIYQGNYLIWLRPRLQEEGILQVIEFVDNAILVKNEVDLGPSPSFESINELPTNLKKRLWHLFKFIKQSAPNKTSKKWSIG